MPSSPTSPASRPGPAWEIARLWPDQGQWTDDDYLALTRDSNHLVELSDGTIEVLPMPTTSHQRIIRFLAMSLFTFVSAAKLGEVLFAPLRVRLRAGKFREPDIVFMLSEHADRIGEDLWDGADLVMEVLSDRPKDRKRDLETKRREYAEAGIAEYWLIDPKRRRISVLSLAGRKYILHAEAGAGERITSSLLPGFSVDVDAVFSTVRRNGRSGGGAA